jgi:hypothetical protein
VEEAAHPDSIKSHPALVKLGDRKRSPPVAAAFAAGADVKAARAGVRRGIGEIAQAAAIGPRCQPGPHPPATWMMVAFAPVSTGTSAIAWAVPETVASSKLAAMNFFMMISVG